MFHQSTSFFFKPHFIITDSNINFQKIVDLFLEVFLCVHRSFSLFYTTFSGSRPTYPDARLRNLFSLIYMSYFFLRYSEDTAHTVCSIPFLLDQNRIRYQIISLSFLVSLSVYCSYNHLAGVGTIVQGFLLYIPLFLE